MSHEKFEVGDRVEVILARPSQPVVVGQRGVVVGPPEWDSAGVFYVQVDYEGLCEPVHSRTDAIRKLPPPTREPVSTWDDVIVWRPKETSHV